jgi:glycerol dehydrogenase
MQSEAFKKSDVVIGIGGGNVMDAAKYCAMLSKKPIVNIPTSSATCAAFTPLSVCYNERGQTVGTTHFEQEVDCVIVDMEILCRQPVRLLVSGIYDSLAKVYELKQRMLGVSQSETDIGLYSSYALSQTLSEILQNNFSQVCLDTQKGENTKAVSDTVFAAIALTGVVSGLARGSNQTAIAHKIYESARYLFPETVFDFLHGEMVAIGLISQIYYNGEGDISAFKEKMKALKMPTSFSELGIAPTQENLMLFYEKIISSSAMVGTTNEEKAKLFEALKIVQ